MTTRIRMLPWRLLAVLALGMGGCGARTEVSPGDDSGAGCGPGRELCGGVCVDTSADRRHCGACDRPCAPAEVCADGLCSASCAPGTTECDGACRDLTTDPEHCGACSRRCAFGESCRAGACVLECGGAEPTLCGDVCVNTEIDRRHCGGCGILCPPGVGCAGGRCEGAACPPGLIECGGLCVDAATDPRHCGGCERVCPTPPNSTPLCDTRVCAYECFPGFADCDGLAGNGCEAELATNSSHCGGCFNACLDGTTCRGGVCGGGGAACHTGPARVLVYDPGLSSLHTSWFPPGTVTTVAREMVWRSMSTADFAAFDVIWIDGGNCTSDIEALMGVVQDTLPTWGPAVRGRIEAMAGDPDLHGGTGAELFYANSIEWLKTQGRTSDGGATSLFISWGCTICCGMAMPGSRGTPELFTSVLGSPLTSDATNFCEDVTITPAGAAHPVMAGVTLWGCPFHGGFATQSAGYVPLVRGNSTTSPALMVREAPVPCGP